MGLFGPSKNIGPNPKPYSERFLSKFYENLNKSCLAQQMTEKIAVEVHAKKLCGKKCKICQKKI